MDASTTVAALREATAWLVDALGNVPDADLGRRAGPLEWDCWTTLDHVGDCLLGYALQVTSGYPTGYLPLEGIDRGEDFIHFPREDGVAGVRTALPPLSRVLESVALTTSPDLRAHHGYGASDPAGFAAMGAVETLLHGHDVLTGLGAAPVLPERPAEVVLARLFAGHDLPDTDPATQLLWAAGRTSVPGRADVGPDWRWDGTVH